MGFFPFFMRGFDRAQFCSHILNFPKYLIPRGREDPGDQQQPPKSVLVQHPPGVAPLVMKFSPEKQARPTMLGDMGLSRELFVSLSLGPGRNRDSSSRNKTLLPAVLQGILLRVCPACSSRAGSEGSSSRKIRCSSFLLNKQISMIVLEIEKLSVFGSWSSSGFIFLLKKLDNPEKN